MRNKTVSALCLGESESIRGSCSRRVALLLVACLLSCIPQCLAQTVTAGTRIPACVLETAKQYLSRGQFKEAEKEVRRILATEPLCPDARFLLAYTLLRENLAKESLAEYTAAARLRTPTSEDLRNVALDYVLLGDYPDADHWAQRALQSDLHDPENLYVLGRIRYGTGKFEDAVKYFEEALAISPDNVKVENNLGLAYEGLNEVDKGIDAYQKAIVFGDKSGKPSEQPMINLAIVLAHRSDLDGALALLTRAVTIAPEDANIREHLGHVYLERNELPQAQVQLEKAVSISPSDARLHFLLGQVYRREGFNENANAEFSRSAFLNGSHSTPDYVK
jgi:Flp pilus assembly protein TadD